MMKAERINQNQIRFTLSAEDLSQRNISGFQNYPTALIRLRLYFTI